MEVSSRDIDETLSDALLLKLNRSAVGVDAANVDAHPLPYWLELARRGLNKVPFNVIYGLTFLGGGRNGG